MATPTSWAMPARVPRRAGRGGAGVPSVLTAAMLGGEGGWATPGPGAASVVVGGGARLPGGLVLLAQALHEQLAGGLVDDVGLVHLLRGQAEAAVGPAEHAVDGIGAAGAVGAGDLGVEHPALLH